MIKTSDYCIRIGRQELVELKVNSGSPEDIADEAIKKSELKLQELLKETRVRIGTLLKMDNVSFLIGAGASYDAGGPLLGSIPKELETILIEDATGQEDDKVLDWFYLFYETLLFLTNHDFEQDKLRECPFYYYDLLKDGIKINLEEYLTHLYTWQASLSEAAHTISLTKIDYPHSLVINSSALKILIEKVTLALVKLVSLPNITKMIERKVATEDPLYVHRIFIKKILNRPLNLRRANLFTLNYDTLLEQGADAEGAVLVDGFVGNLQKVFRPESFNLDFYFPAQTTEGRVHRFDRALHLYKLHGSLTWRKAGIGWENPYGLYSTFSKQHFDEDNVMIYPTPMKYGQTLGLPYSELFRRFGNAVVQPQSILFVIGYGFGDEHVNAIIRQALAIPSFTLVVIDPEPKSDFVKQLKKLDDERVWIISGWKLGTFTSFVGNLLPDLCEEEIMSKVIKTVQALNKPGEDHNDQ